MTGYEKQAEKKAPPSIAVTGINVTYHLKRIHELVEYNPEDTYTLDYMKISMRVLNMLEREKMIGGG